MAKKKKFRAEFRKNRTPRARKTDWTRQFDEHGFQEQAPETEERISGRGEMNRHRTICTSDAAAELGNAEIPLTCFWMSTWRPAAAAACSRFSG